MVGMGNSRIAPTRLKDINNKKSICHRGHRGHREIRVQKVAVGAGFMPARNPGESESSGGGEPRPYEKNISRYAQLFTTLCIDACVYKPESKSPLVAVGAGFMPARNPGESESSGGGEPRPYIKKYFLYLAIHIKFPYDSYCKAYASWDSC